METTMTHIVDVLDRQRKIDRQQISEEAYRLYLNLHPELKLEGVLTLYMDEEISLSSSTCGINTSMAATPAREPSGLKKGAETVNVSCLVVASTIGGPHNRAPFFFALRYQGRTRGS